MKMVIALLLSITGYLSSMQNARECSDDDSRVEYYDINGVYERFDSEIIIQDSLLQYKLYPFSYEDSLVSNCIIKRVGREFIEVSSQPSDFRVSYSEQYLNYDSPDSISVRLLFPIKKQLYVRAKISSHTPRVDYVKEDIIDTGCFVFRIPNIPHSVGTMSVKVELVDADYIFPVSPGRSMNMSYEYFDPVLLDQNVEISITGLDEDYFKRAYIKGEYMRVLPDSLVWNDSVFLKRKPGEKGIVRFIYMDPPIPKTKKSVVYELWFKIMLLFDCFYRLLFDCFYSVMGV